MPKLVLLRHGQSTWNEENRFTGWTDVDLSDRGVGEARQAGDLLRDAGFSFDVAFTSVLKRAIRTLWIVLDRMDLMWIPTTKHWRLNERHYGDLQGLNKAEMAAMYGEAQVLQWRRSYDVRPPALEPTDERVPARDPRYRGLRPDELPLTECLADTVARVIPYWREVIAPAITRGDRVIVAAHGNSLRALVKYLDGIGDAEIVGLNIPTGVPLVYELTDDLRPIHHQSPSDPNRASVGCTATYLGDPDAIAAATAAVASQGKAS